MSESRILAVEHVEMQTRRGREEALLWFYRELIGLDVVDEPRRTPPRLRFRSAKLELRYTLVPAPRTESTAHRVSVLTDSLAEARKVLDEASVPYTTVTGMTFTDRFLSVVDPGGNRVAIRQAWRRIG